MSRLDGVKDLARMAGQSLIEKGQDELERIQQRLSAQAQSEEACRDLGRLAPQCASFEEFCSSEEIRAVWKRARHAARLQNPNQVIPFTPEEQQPEDDGRSTAGQQDGPPPTHP